MAAVSILTSIKKLLGLGEEYTPFDMDVTIHINSALAVLTQMGIGPSTGFAIEDATTTWDAFVTDLRMNAVKTFVYLKVRLIFDPPQNSYVIAAFEKEIEQATWRLSVTREGDSWIDPTPPVPQIEWPWDQVWPL